jgi:hypothetical protein
MNYLAASSGPKVTKHRDLRRRKRRGIRPVGAVRSPWKMMVSVYDESTTGF